MTRAQAEVAHVCKQGGAPCQLNFAQQRDIGSDGCRNTYSIEMMRYFHGGSAEARRAVLHCAIADAEAAEAAAAGEGSE